jgi:N-acetylmuramoyl-L-alanine amidase CwlA
MASTNNYKFLGIECCHPDASGKFSDKTRSALVELVATLCNKYGFAVQKDVYRHYDVSGKSCPLWYVNNPAEWDKLKNDISTKLNQIKQPTTPTPAPAPAPTNNQPSDWAKEAWAWAKTNNLNDGTRPRDTATREEVAAIVWRASKFLSSK